MGKKNFKKLKLRCFLQLIKQYVQNSVINKLSEGQPKADQELAVFALNRDYFWANCKAKKKSPKPFFLRYLFIYNVNC